MRADDSMLGNTIDKKYRIDRLLGQGGMGAVYAATHLGTGRRVALKVITGALMLTRDAIVRFQREARAAGCIESQHIVQVLDTGVDTELGVPFLVMEYLVGEDLQGLCARLGCLAPELALRIVAQACTGLQKAHEAGVVHRDIKPANLFLARGDEGDVKVRLLDFGIAKVKVEQQLGVSPEQGLTQSGSMLGSPMYMSPEQAMGLKTIDQRTDVWSLGAVLYEALAGHPPHVASASLGQLIMAICSVPAPPLQQAAPWVAPELAEVVHRALRIDPQERFQTADEFRRALRALLPNGSSLNEDLLVPMSADERQRIAARFSVPSDAPPQVGLQTRTADNQANYALTGTPVTSTGSGVGKRKTPLVGGILFGLVLSAAGLWFGVVGPRLAAPIPSASPAGSEGLATTDAPKADRAEVTALAPAAPSASEAAQVGLESARAEAAPPQASATQPKGTSSHKAGVAKAQPAAALPPTPKASVTAPIAKANKPAAGLSVDKKFDP